MTRRETTLALVTAIGALAFLGVIAFDRYYKKPLEEEQTRQLALLAEQGELTQLQVRTRMASRKLDELAARSFGGNANEASARVGRYLTRELARAELAGTAFTRIPLGSRRVLGGREVNWSVEGRGPSRRVLDFVDLLERGPRLQRIERLSLRPQAGGELSLQLGFTALILDPPRARSSEELVEPSLEDEARGALDALAERDVFRPYRPRPVVPPKPPEPEPPPVVVKAPPPPPPPPPGPENYRVLSLSRWRGRDEVVLLDVKAGTTRTYGAGDSVVGLIIRGIEYRHRPAHAAPGLSRSSRLLIEVAEAEGAAPGELKAVDPGATLEERYPIDLRLSVKAPVPSDPESSKK